MYQCHYLHCAQSLLWWHVPSVPVYQCHYLHRAQSLLWWHVPSVPVSLFTPCTESVVVTCTQCTSVTIYTVHSLLWWHVPSVPVSLFTLVTESVVVTCTQCTSVTIYTVHRVCCGDMYPVYQCHYLHRAQSLLWWHVPSVPVSLFTPCTVCCGDMYPVYQCHYLHWSQILLWWHVPSVPVSLFTPCIESVVVTCTQCTSVTIYTVHRVCCGDMYPVYQCHYLHRAQSLLWWHVPSVPVSLFTPCTESVVVTCTCTCTQCTSVTIYTVHRVCCGDMYPVYQCHYLHCAQSLLWWHVHVPSVLVSLFTPCTESVVVIYTQCTSVTIYTVHRVCCADMYPVYQCHYLHRAQSLLWWHVPSVPVSLFTPCTESVVVTCTQCTCVTIYTVHRVCCGDMYPVYQCHYLHRAHSLLWWHVPSVPVYQFHYLHRAQSLLWWHIPSVPVSLFTPCTESVVVTCTQCTSVTIYTVHRVCCGDMYMYMYPVYQCHYLHRAQSLLWWHVPSVPVSLFTLCTESVVVTCSCTQCTSVTIYTVHRVCCGDIYPVYKCHYLHRAQSLLWWHVPSVPVSLFTPCTESVVVTCTQCTSVTVYTVHTVCCGDMYSVYQCTSVTIYTVHRVCCGDIYPVYQCHYLHRAQSLLWWHVPSVPVSLFTPCTESVVVTCTQCTSVTIYTVHRVCCGDMYPVYQCHYLHHAQSLLWWHVPSVPVSLFTPCTESVVVTCTQCTSVTIYTVHSLLWWHVPSVPVSLFTPCTESVVVTCTHVVYQCHYLHRAQSLLWWHVPSVPVSLFTPCTESVVVTCTQRTSVTIYTVHRVCCGDMYPVYQCHYLHRAQSLLWWHVPSVPVSLFTPCTESVVVTCTQCTSVTIYTVHRVCCGDMYPVYQCHYLHRAQSLLWWHVPSVPVSLFTPCTESVVVTCTQCTSVTIYTVHRVCCGDMYPVYQCHYLHRAQSLLWWHVPSVPVSLFTPCTESVVVTCTQCTSVTIYTVHRVCCGDMYPVYQCHYLHRAQSLLWWHVPSVPVSLFTPCTESVVVTCTQCTCVTIYTVHRVCCGDMYPVYQCHYLHRAHSLLWWHVPSVPVYQFHYLHRAQSLLWWHIPSVPVSLFTPCTESVVVTCTQCTSVTIYTVHRVCCGDMYMYMYPVYQCHYLHRAQSLLWWHVPSVPVSLFTLCTESVVVTCSCTQCTSVTIYTVHRVCCGDIYPVYKCHYLHRAQSLLWWHVPSVPVSLFTPCTESVVVTCTQCTSVTVYTVHTVCCGDMYSVYQCTSVTIYTVHRVCCGDIYPVYQCHYLHRAQSLLWWHVPSVPVSLFTPCTESVVVTCTQCTSVTIYTVHRVCCGDMYPVYQCHYLHHAQSLLWWHVPSVPVSLFTPCTESVVVTCTQCTSVTIYTVHSLLWWHVPSVPVSLFTPCTESVVVTCTHVVYQCHYLHRAQSLLWWHVPSVPVSLFTPCTESVVVTCTQRTSVTIYTVHRVCCGDMYPVYQCHYLHRAQSLLWWHVPSVPVSLFTPCTESVVVTCTQCTSVTIYTVHRVCCGDMYPVYQCHYLHRAQSLLWWHVPSVPVSLFTPCTESVVVTCTQCTSVTIYTVHRVCCGDMYPVYQCHYLHRAQSLLWWHVPSVPVSLFTPCTESVVVTCTQCTSVTIYTVHRVCCGDMYPVYQCHYLHRAQSLLWWHVPSVPVSLFTPCIESVVVTCTQCTSVTIYTVHRVWCFCFMVYMYMLIL